MSCRLIEPEPSLASNIYYYWILRIEAMQVDLSIIPDNAVDLVLSPEIPDFSALYFPSSEKFTIPLNGPVTYVGVCFHSDRISAIFSRSLEELKKLEPGGVTTSGLDIKSLVESVQGLDEEKEIAQVFNDFFNVFFDESHGHNRHEPLRWWEMGIFENLEAGSVQSMAEQMGLSERQFRRITSHLFGMGPKKVHRVVRLQQALQSLFSADARLLSEGYYDDSHMIKELKALTGMTPKEIRRMAEIYNQKKSI